MYSLSLSFYHLLSKFANSLDPDDRPTFRRAWSGANKPANIQSGKRMSYLFASDAHNTLGILVYLKEKKISDKYHISTFSSMCMQCAVSSMCQPAQFKLNCQRTHFYHILVLRCPGSVSPIYRSYMVNTSLDGRFLACSACMRKRTSLQDWPST